nr:protein PHR1-LIKE 2-like [Tanacetum cinerariifolium]
TSHPFPSVKSLSYKVGGMLRCCNSTNRYERLDSELERKLMELKKRYVPGNSSIRSLNSIILRFPQFRQGLEEIRGVFGQFEATPKMIMRTMGVKGLTLYHLKSHLQDMGSVTSSSTRMLPQDLNDGFEVTEALRVQMEVQRRLHEQLEVQQRLQLRIESQGKYLQSILEKACKALNDQAIATAGLDAAREHVTTHIENEHAPNVDSSLSSQADAAKKRQRAMFMQSEWRGV